MTIIAVALIFAFLGLIILSVFNVSAFPIDDAFISFRYARNLIDGFGLVFNQGERVEAYSNFLWVFLVSGLGYVTGLSPILAARFLGLASLTAMGLLLFLQLRRSGTSRRDVCGPGAGMMSAPRGPTRSLLLPFTISFIVFLLPETIFHALSGLETILSAVFLLAGGSILESDIEPRKKAWLAGLILAAFSLNRPEGLLLFACVLIGVGALWLVSGKNGTHPMWLGAAYACVLLPFLVWRFLYYGTLLPNSVLAKSGFLHPVVLKAGGDYLGSFLVWHSPVVLLAVFAFFSGQRAQWVSFRIPAAVALSVTALLGGVGDGYPYSRYLYPLFACLVAWSFEGGLLIGRSAGRNRGRAVGAFAFLTLLVGVQLILFAHELRHAPLIASELAPLSRPIAFFRETPESANPGFLRANGLGHRQAATWLTEHASRGDLLATYEIGIVPYFSRLPVLDLFGLADRHIAQNAGVPGQRLDLPYVWNRKPAYFMSRVPSDCLCSYYPIFLDRRFRDDYDLAGLFRYWATDILLFKRRAEPAENVVYDLARGSFADRRLEGPIRLLEPIQLLRQGQREKLIAEIRRTRAPEVMRQWIGTWRSAFVLPSSERAGRGTISFKLLVPEDGKLVFGVGVTAAQPSASSEVERWARVRILVSHDHRTAKLFERAFDEKNPAAGWEDHRVDLKRFAGRRIGLSFEIENQGIPADVALGDPRIITNAVSE